MAKRSNIYVDTNCEQLDSGSTNDTDIWKTIDFGTINTGFRSSMEFLFVNEDKVVRRYRAKRQSPKVGELRSVYKLDTTESTLRPSETWKIIITFRPLRPFQTYNEYVIICNDNGPLTQICLKGKSIGPYLVIGNSEIILRTNPCSEAEKEIEIRNESPVPSEFYFEVDNENCIFKFDPDRCRIEGKGRVNITVKFHAPFEGAFEKYIFCMIDYQAPIRLHVVGMCSRYICNDINPTLNRFPRVEPALRRQSTLEEYIHREWEEFVEFTPKGIIKTTAKDPITTFQVKNKTESAFTLVWCQEQLKRFTISPSVCILLPKLTTTFRVQFNSMIYREKGKLSAYNVHVSCGCNTFGREDSAISSDVDGWLFWEPEEYSLSSLPEPWKQCQTYLGGKWLSSSIPINIEVKLIGQYAIKEKSQSAVCCVAVPEILTFQIVSNTVNLYAYFIIKTLSRSRVLYKITHDKCTEYIAKHMEGIVKDDEFRVIIVGHTGICNHLDFLEKWQIAIDGREACMAKLLLKKTNLSLNVEFGEEGECVTFSPAVLGDCQQKIVIVHNRSPYWCRISHVPDEIPWYLNVGPSQYLIGPNEKIYQIWKFKPNTAGWNYKDIIFQAEEVAAPDIEELMANIKECTLSSYGDTSVCKKNQGTGELVDKINCLSCQTKEIEILVRILCRHNFPVMKPENLIITDYIMTQPAFGRFELFNPGDVPMSYSLCIQHEPLHDKTVDSKIDQTKIVDDPQCEIFPNLTILNKYESRQYEFMISAKDNNPHHYSVVVGIKQSCDKEVIFEKGAHSVPSCKIGTITCQGAWPRVKISDVKSSINEGFFNHIHLWKCFNIDGLNEALKFNFPHKRNKFNMVFPDRPLNSEPIEYYLKLQNLSPIPMKWKFQLVHNRLEMPPLKTFQHTNEDNITHHTDATLEGLQYLKELIWLQQQKAWDTQDDSYLRKIQCCSKREPRQWTSSGRRIHARNCPLGSVIRIVPEEGIIKARRTEILKVVVQHELEGKYTFDYLLKLEIADGGCYEYLVEDESIGDYSKSTESAHQNVMASKECCVISGADEGGREEMFKDIAKYTGAIPKRPKLCTDKTSFHHINKKSTVPDEKFCGYEEGTKEEVEWDFGPDHRYWRNDAFENSPAMTPISLQSQEVDSELATDGGSQLNVLHSASVYEGIQPTEDIEKHAKQFPVVVDGMHLFDSDSESTMDEEVHSSESISEELQMEEPKFNRRRKEETVSNECRSETAHDNSWLGTWSEYSFHAPEPPNNSHDSLAYLLPSSNEEEVNVILPSITDSEGKMCRHSVLSTPIKKRHSEPILAVKHPDIPLHNFSVDDIYVSAKEKDWGLSKSSNRKNIYRDENNFIPMSYSKEKTDDSELISEDLSSSSHESQMLVKVKSGPRIEKFKEVLVSDQNHLLRRKKFKQNMNTNSLLRSKRFQNPNWGKWILKNEMTRRGPVDCSRCLSEPLRGMQNKECFEYQPVTQDRYLARQNLHSEAPLDDIVISTPSTASLELLNNSECSPRELDVKEMEAGFRIEENGCDKLSVIQRGLKGKRRNRKKVTFAASVKGDKTDDRIPINKKNVSKDKEKSSKGKEKSSKNMENPFYDKKMRSNDKEKLSSKKKEKTSNNMRKPSNDKEKPSSKEKEKSSNNMRKPSKDKEKPSSKEKEKSSNNMRKPSNDREKPSSKEKEKSSNNMRKPSKDKEKPSSKEKEKSSNNMRKPSNDREKPSSKEKEKSSNNMRKPSKDKEKPSSKDVEKLPKEKKNRTINIEKPSKHKTKSLQDIEKLTKYNEYPSKSKGKLSEDKEKPLKHKEKLLRDKEKLLEHKEKPPKDKEKSTNKEKSSKAMQNSSKSKGKTPKPKEMLSKDKVKLVLDKVKTSENKEMTHKDKEKPKIGKEKLLRYKEMSPKDKGRLSTDQIMPSKDKVMLSDDKDKTSIGKKKSLKRKEKSLPKTKKVEKVRKRSTSASTGKSEDSKSVHFRGVLESDSSLQTNMILNASEQKLYSAMRCISLENMNEPNGSMYELIGKESYFRLGTNPVSEEFNVTFYCDLVTKLKQYKVQGLHARSECLHGLHPRSLKYDPLENDQMIFDRMFPKKCTMPNEVEGSKFNLCEEGEYNIKEPGRISFRQKQELDLILSDLISLKREDTPSSSSRTHGDISSLTILPPEPCWQSRALQSTDSLHRISLEESRKKRKPWQEPKEIVAAVLDLKFTISSYSEKKEESSIHPTLYSDQITMADVCIGDNRSSFQVMWIYNPHKVYSMPYVVEKVTDEEGENSMTFTCINQAGILNPKSVHPLLIQFQPQEIGLHKGHIDIKFGAKESKVIIEGNGVGEVVSDFHSCQPEAPTLSLFEEPELPFILSVEKIVVAKIIPISSKVLRLMFIVNTTNKDVSFHWKEFICPSILSGLVDISVHPSHDVLSPFQVLPLLLTISKASKRICDTNLEERLKRVQKIQCSLGAVDEQCNAGIVGNVDGSSSLIIDWYPLICEATHSSQCMLESTLEEENKNSHKVRENLHNYQRPLIISFGMSYDNAWEPDMDINEVASNYHEHGRSFTSPFVFPNFESHFKQADTIWNLDKDSCKCAIGNILEGIIWKLLNSRWLYKTLQRECMEDTAGNASLDYLASRKAEDSRKVKRLPNSQATTTEKRRPIKCKDLNLAQKNKKSNICDRVSVRPICDGASVQKKSDLQSGTINRICSYSPPRAFSPDVTTSNRKHHVFEQDIPKELVIQYFQDSMHRNILLFIRHVFESTKTLEEN